MKEKNVKGIIALCLALASVLLNIIAFIPMEKLTGFDIDGKIAFFGSVNVTLSQIALIFAIAAIVLGIMARKHTDKKGPRKSGLIIGIIFIFVSLITLAITAGLSTITEYINSDGKSGVIYESIKNDESKQKEMNDFIDQFKKQIDVKS